VEAAVPAPTPEQLATAQIPVSSDLDRYRALPPGETGPIFAMALDAAGDGLPYAQATALADWLKRHYRYDPLAPGGSGYPSIVRFLTGEPRVGGGRGTSEQFAAAYAVLARALGIPARVVVGFAPESGEGTTTVTAGDARAWPEIYLEPVGWIAMDVTAPQATDDPDAHTPPPPPPPADEPSEPEPTATDAPVGLADEAATGSSFPLVPLAVPALVAAALALVAALRLRRSRRRRAGTDDVSRLRGAWRELLDAARLAGIRHEPQWTVATTVAVVSQAVAVPPEAHLVAAVNRAWYAAEPDAGGAALATAQAMDLARRARRTAGWWRRLVWWVDPRPLWW